MRPKSFKLFRFCLATLLRVIVLWTAVDPFTDSRRTTSKYIHEAPAFENQDSSFVAGRWGNMFSKMAVLDTQDTLINKEYPGTILFDGHYWWGLDGVQWLGFGWWDSSGGISRSELMDSLDKYRIDYKLAPINIDSSRWTEFISNVSPRADSASMIKVDTTTFERNLSGADTTIQKALETLDDLEILLPSDPVPNDDYSAEVIDIYPTMTQPEIDGKIDSICSNYSSDIHYIFYFHNGNYYNFYTQYYMQDNISFIGESKEGVHLFQYSSTSSIFAMHSSDWTIANFTFHISSTIWSSYGIATATNGIDYRLRVQNCDFYITNNQKGHAGIYCAYEDQVIIKDCNFYGVNSVNGWITCGIRWPRYGGTVINCTFNNLHKGINGYYQQTVIDNRKNIVSNCRFTDCWYGADFKFYSSGDNLTETVQIENSYFSNSTYYDIRFDDACATRSSVVINIYLLSNQYSLDYPRRTQRTQS
jgi:hypothetical protein